MLIKNITRFLIKAFAVLLIVFILLGVFANYYKEYLKENRKPIWVSTDVSINANGFVIDEKEGVVLTVNKGDLVLNTKGSAGPYMLFKNHKSKFSFMKMYRKDLDQDGNKELVFLVDKGMYKSDVYVFSNLKVDLVNKYKADGFWFDGALLFTNEGQMYFRTCGSSYCEDTYYIWDGVKLDKEYTDGYESM